MAEWLMGFRLGNDLTGSSAAASLPSSACMACNIVHIHVDADRDGVIDDRPAGDIWTGGKTGRGAIISVNNDNDDGKAGAVARDNTDNSDTKINSSADLRDIAPLDLRKMSDLPLEGARVILSVPTTPLDYRGYIRIFDGRSAGSTEIIGSATGSEKAFTEADFKAGRIELGMEALRYPTRAVGDGTVDFDGRIQLILRVEGADGTVIHRETVPVRVAPWIVFNHTDITETVYVAEINEGYLDDNSRFIGELRKVVGGKLRVIPAGEADGDRWAQDVMEMGFSNWPGDRDLTTVIRTPRTRGGSDQFGKYPGRVLLGLDFGYYELNALEQGSSLNSFGNLECSPPIPGYPFGRVVYGTPGMREAVRYGHSPMKSGMRALLEGQELQSPIKLDTGWLMVGHVDEFMSFIPDPSGTHGFKIAFASPRLAVSILRENPRGLLFQGILANDGSTSPIAEYTRILGGDVPYDEYGSAAVILGNEGFLTLQNEIQGILNSQKNALKSGLSLKDSDFIDLPILFYCHAPESLSGCIALTPGSVNMLVVTHAPGDIDLVIPKPFGPTIGGICMYEKAIKAAFAPNRAVTPHFVDCFLTYHVLQGEIHCGTNSKRKPPKKSWWHHSA